MFDISNYTGNSLGKHDRERFDSTEIYSFESNSWREGPKYPKKVSMAFGVQYEHTFIAVGGILDNSQGETAIYKYNPGKEVISNLINFLNNKKIIFR